MTKNEILIAVLIFAAIVSVSYFYVSRKLNSSNNIVLDTAKNFTPNLRKV